MKRSAPFAWVPAAVMAFAALLTGGLNLQRPMALRQPLGYVVPREIAGYVATDLTLSEEELRVAGVTDYLMRVYEPPDTTREGPFSVYIGYYEQQRRGQTIHSPKNCLPGSGWAALGSTTAEIATADGPVTVNRYLLQRDEEHALVLYWYQGRGRVQANEYAVKWDLLRDSALRGRSDEALVRVVVPISTDSATSASVGTHAASRVLQSLHAALP
jgi:EpsI family protein